jgi:hypothetical protein
VEKAYVQETQLRAAARECCSDRNGAAVADAAAAYIKHLEDAE